MPKTRTRPEKLLVGNHVYDIIWLSTSEWDERRYDEAADALTYATTQAIIIKVHNAVSESHFQEVLWHEIMHACWDATMLTHVDLHDGIKDVEEFTIAAVSPMSLFVLKNNPDLVKYLLDDGTERREQ